MQIQIKLHIIIERGGDVRGGRGILRHLLPPARLPAPGSRLPVPVPGSRLPAPGSRFPAPVTRNEGLEVITLHATIYK